MKRRIPKFAFVLLTACSSLAFASCNKGPAGPNKDTYKFVQQIDGHTGTVYNIGDDDYGLIFSPDYIVYELYYDGTAAEHYQEHVGTSVWVETLTGTWTNEGINYTITFTARDGTPLETPAVEQWTISEGVMSDTHDITTSEGYYWTTILRKV